MILDFLVINTYNTQTLGVADISTYDTNPPNVSGANMEITIPGFPDPVNVPFIPQDFNVYNSIILGLTDFPLLAPLPDGVYFMKYSVAPATTYFREKNIMRTDRIQEKFDAAFMKLDMMECDSAIRTQAKVVLNSVWYMIQGSIAAATATNIDESITKLPVFSIVKTVSQTLDINKPNATAEYTIVVKNDNTGTASYAADAINIKIVDNLPIGLKLVTSSLTQASITTTGAATKGTISQNTKGAGAGTAVDGFEISGVDIPVGESVTIKFQVQKPSRTF